MKLTVTLAAEERIKPYLNDETRLLLSLDDGVGPFSKVGSCALNIAFEIIAVNKDAETPDYQDVIESNVGPFYVKDYSTKYLDSNLKLDYKANRSALVLSGDSGIIDSGVRVEDLTNVKA